MYDLVIVGGGPVGLATAVHARNQGMEPVVIDRRDPPIDKPCGEGLMPSGVDELEQLGIDPGAIRGRRFTGIRYFDGDHMLEGKFPHGRGLACRRTALHEALVDRARKDDIEIRWQTTARALGDQAVETNGNTIRGRWIIGADGLHSSVRQWADLEQSNGRTERFGHVQHYEVEPWTDYVEVYWTEDHELYIAPVADHLIGVAALSDRRQISVHDCVTKIPRLQTRLAGTALDDRSRGWGPLYQTTSGVRNGRICLVGDAAGYRDAITGEGMSIGLKQARNLVDCLAREAPSEYENRYRRITRTPFAVIEGLLFLRRHPGWRRAIMNLLGEQSRLFSTMLSINDRGVSSTFFER